MNLNFDQLKEQVTNLSLYDIKAGVRKVQNGKCTHVITFRTLLTIWAIAVMNYTEMESKVREATNNEPWGASTTVRYQIPFFLYTLSASWPPLWDMGLD